ncbi:hypothetical protein C8R44DRAFT_957849 [Mycena epipterygia]|nr:hypothetical protein C8R44DRAFT_957849 [Mycena epipterygia]
MPDTENFRFSSLFAKFFGHDLGIKEGLTATAAKPFSLFADEGTDTPRKPAIRHGLSGFGRRNSLLVIYVAAVVLANPVLLKGLRLHFSIYEMQKETEEGSGNSFQTTCNGALNTGIPGQVTIPAVATGGLSPDIADLTNLAQCITAELQKNIPEHKKALKEANLAALVLAVGKIMQRKIQKALAYIQEHMSDMITIERHFEEEIVGLVVTNPQRPKLKVRKVGTTDVPHEEEFDFVHLAHGTPWALPPGVIPGPTVSSAIPNQNSIGQFLAANDLLLENGRIKSGAHIGITGLSLSAYDYVPLVLRYTSLIEPTETGYTIRPENAVHYQGLLTFISRDGVPAPPRLHAKHFANRPPILGTSEELHALQLQKHFDWLSFWTVFVDANVARFLGKLPKDLRYRQTMDIKARMVDYARQTEAYRRGEQAEVGLRRTGFWLAYGGQGFYVDPDDAEKAELDLVEKAPLTRKDRTGFLLRRGSLADVTSTAYVDVQSNKAFMDAYTILHSCVTASPPGIQYLVARMFELGVATHAAGDFKDVVPTLHSDVLLTPNLLDRNNDAVLVSLGNTVKEIVRGQPEYAKGRFLRTPDGALVHAIDMGMGGKGTRVAHLAGSGEESIIGMRWPDTNFLDAGVDGAASLAPMTVLLSSIAAQGDKHPAESLLKCYYEKVLPSKRDFEEEIEQFKSVWKEVQEKHAFLVLCEAVAGNALEYLECTDKVFASDSREKPVGGWERAKQHAAATDKYREAVKSIRAFDPPSVEMYFEQFVDLSPSEVQKCWDAHMKMDIVLGQLCTVVERVRRSVELWFPVPIAHGSSDNAARQREVRDEVPGTPARKEERR